jgi:hypothetical protein
MPSLYTSVWAISGNETEPDAPVLRGRSEHDRLADPIISPSPPKKS